MKRANCSTSVAFAFDLWLKRKAETGDVKAKPNKPSGNGHKILDWNKFREFAKANGEKTQAEMAQLWSGEISARTIRARLKENRIYAKKKTYGLQLLARDVAHPMREDLFVQMKHLVWL